MGFEEAKSTQEFQIMVLVVGSIFGGKKNNKPPETFAAATKSFAGVFGKKG